MKKRHQKGNNDGDSDDDSDDDFDDADLFTDVKLLREKSEAVVAPRKSEEDALSDKKEPEDAPDAGENSRTGLEQAASENASHGEPHELSQQFDPSELDLDGEIG